MTVDRATLAALRFGTGLRPDRQADPGPGALMVDLRATAAAPPLATKKDEARLIAAVTDLRAARVRAGEMAGRGDETPAAPATRDQGRNARAARDGDARGMRDGDARGMRDGDQDARAARDGDGHGDQDARGMRDEVAERRERRAKRRAAATAEMQGAAMQDEDSFATELRDLRRELEDMQIEAIARAVASPHGFGERMARFWSNHFAVSVKFPGHWARVAVYEDQAIRPNLHGRFADLLGAVTRHPAMLMFLDQDASVGPNSALGRRTGRGLNENLAREVLELHTLGVDGPYRQADVQALARLLTGMSVSNAGYVWRARRAEPGRVSLLGRPYEGRSEDELTRALGDLARHPATAAHVCGKIAAHFVADVPPPELVAAMTEAWRDTDGDLGAVCRALVFHPAAWGPPGQKLRQPWELVVAALRAAGAQPEDVSRNGRFPRGVTLGALAEMGQSPGRPPGPDGWPEEAEAWITPAGLAARLRWGARLGRVLEADLDPRVFAEAALGPALTPVTAKAVAAASERWEAYAVFLASPDFNRR